MSDPDDVARRYLAAWNERDPARRRALVDALWTDDAVHVDPIATAAGRAAVDAVIATAQRQFPGLGYRAAGSADGHHGVVRLTWELAPEGGPAVIIGVVVLVTDGARVRAGYGFLDPVPTEAGVDS
ncbi:nuclear transport factor 2 family protein [Actinokineospora sp. UTMC 2448]|uniref:nuclear transport factor 2 family protein n=1 Tax=Actinokineospora sp. UTMC 2448 TaxID=2268449 RepID=UPI00216453DE|nr:nuclear transport factor 2 family protein [Actinokineospora sp. UTMC 2448]UVS80407.1 SnoaL-like domain protein [Actinokineospora sp. UTMC 2448]